MRWVRNLLSEIVLKKSKAIEAHGFLPGQQPRSCMLPRPSAAEHLTHPILSPGLKGQIKK